MVNSLSAGLGAPGKDMIRDIVEGMGLSSSVRAEQLSVEQFAELAMRLKDVEGKGSQERVRG
jgi:16S rRNA A1518/A1519 N6-dimethyltransferase RsmA/KsgA/DIM1 with predicted DNA glycosylase/AP lyase activity